MKVEVEFSPLQKIALVWEGPTTIWLVRPGHDTEREPAPNMWNIHWGDQHYEVVPEMEDEHPFPKVLQELEQRIQNAR